MNKTLQKLMGMNDPLTLEQLKKLGFEDTNETKEISRYRILKKGRYKVLYDTRYQQTVNSYEEEIE